MSNYPFKNWVTLNLLKPLSLTFWEKAEDFLKIILLIIWALFMSNEVTFLQAQIYACKLYAKADILYESVKK